MPFAYYLTPSTYCLIPFAYRLQRPLTFRLIVAMDSAVQSQSAHIAHNSVGDFPMSMNSNPEMNSTQYNALKERIESLRLKKGDEELNLLIVQLLRETDALETLRKQECRAASTSFVQQATEFERRFAKISEQLDLLAELEAKLEAIQMEPKGFGTFVRHLGFHEMEDRRGNTHKMPIVDVRDARGIEGRVLGDENLNVSSLIYGQKLLLLGTSGPNYVMELLNEFNTSGREANVVNMMESDHYGTRVLLSMGDMQEKRVCWLAGNMQDKGITAGSRVLVDPVSNLIIEALPEQESSRFLVGETSHIRFENIGGLDSIIAELQEDFAWPMLYASEYASLGIPSPRGCLLYGAPGVGKTLIAKALVNFMADQIEKTTGHKATGHFFHIGGPAMLSRWVGHTEEMIRGVFEEAKKLASPVNPVIIFFDEMDSMFGQRGSQISSDVNIQHVTQLCSMMDGLEDRGNVIVVGATNRDELIDPAVLRPGRMDKRILIPRPNAAAAKDIFGKYLLPLWGQINSRYNVQSYAPVNKHGTSKGVTYKFECDPEKVREYLIERAVGRMYDEKTRKNQFVILRFEGKTEPEFMRYGDLASGAMIENIVARAKKLALHDHIMDKTALGVEMKHLFLAIEAAFAEQRAPKTLDEITHWLVTQKQDKGQLIAHPRFVDHTEPASVEEY
ncbi:MAG: AAA family ATPase [bacterium]|nr:AAA family ATPase [bacterium]